MPENIFVLGLDDLNLQTVRDMPHLARYNFHHLLSVEELTEAEEIDLAALLDKAQRQLEAFDGSVDAIMGWWDFPVSSMVPILCERFDLSSPGLESVVKCEDKFWSRIEQQKAIKEHPAFGIVDLEGEPEPPPAVPYPMWLKPVKSFSSDLAFKVGDKEEFDRAVAEIRQGIGRVGKAFDYLLSLLDLPSEIAEVGGQACMAEEAVGGAQVTVEGYSEGGHVHAYGVIDSINYEGTSSFLRYQYPSQLPEPVINRLIDISKRVIRQVGLEPSTFNIEYFWDAERDKINLLEVNPRLSQSHAKLFEAVDGAPNLQCMVQLALGQKAQLPSGEGEYEIAGKWFLRRFSDGVVRRVPTAEEVERIQQDIPGVTVDIIPSEGERLSDLRGQDSYSYELADIFIGAHDQAELEGKYERCVRALNFEFDQ